MIYIPELTPVKSSSVKAVAYEYGVLYVQFTNNTVYCYKDVPAEKYDELLKASSIGRFVAKEIIPVYKDYDYLK